MRACTLLFLAVAAAVPAQHVHTNRTSAKRLPLTKEEGVWHFVVFGDRTGGPDEGIKILAQAVRDTNLLDPDLVMTVGDLIDGYNETPQWTKQMRVFQNTMRGLRMPWFPVAGNHDTYWRQRKGGEKKPLNEHDGHYEEHFGPLWYWFAHKDAAFIVLYTDETMAGTNDKNYQKAGGQVMSPEQRAWLAQTLKKTRGFEHCLVFLHHPRWITSRYPHSDWKEVEAMLQDAGNVSGVFAGHIHRMHFAETAARPGGRPLPYYTLAATGANLSDPPLGTRGYDHSASMVGAMHHMNIVTVRKGKITVAAIPVGAVIDPRTMTAERTAALRALRGRRPSYAGVPLPLKQDGSTSGKLGLEIENPTTGPVEFTLTPDPRNSRIVFWPDHAHLTVPAGGKRKILFHYARGRGDLGSFAAPEILEEASWVGEGFRIATPPRTIELEISLPKRLPEREPADRDGVLELDGDGCVRVPSSLTSPPDGPLTIEAWVRADSLDGRRPLVTKTEDSEFGLFISEGQAKFLIYVGGEYRRAVMPEGKLLKTKRWHHVAGVYDGKTASLFVDGRRVASVETSGARTKNDHPLFVGADPNPNGNPVDMLRGQIDEVRLSSVARYSNAFTPRRRHRVDSATLLLLHLDREVGPLTPDSSGRGAHGTLQQRARCGTPLLPLKR